LDHWHISNFRRNKRLIMPTNLTFNKVRLVFLAISIVPFAMAIYIGVGLERPWAPWVISMFVGHGIAGGLAILSLLYSRFAASDSSDDDDISFVLVALIWSLQLATTIAWLVTLVQMFERDHPNCSSDSGWFRALVPTSGNNPEHVAYVKCVFSIFQLAEAIRVLLILGIMVFAVFIPGWVRGITVLLSSLRRRIYRNKRSRAMSDLDS